MNTGREFTTTRTAFRSVLAPFYCPALWPSDDLASACIPCQCHNGTSGQDTGSRPRQHSHLAVQGKERPTDRQVMVSRLYWMPSGGHSPVRIIQQCRLRKSWDEIDWHHYKTQLEQKSRLEAPWDRHLLIWYHGNLCIPWDFTEGSFSLCISVVASILAWQEFDVYYY